MLNKRGILIVLSGFSGAGKGTIMKELIKDYPYFLSISATTRKPREGEQHGREYYFHTREEFEQVIAQLKQMLAPVQPITEPTPQKKMEVLSF